MTELEKLEKSVFTGEVLWKHTSFLVLSNHKPSTISLALRILAILNFSGNPSIPTKRNTVFWEKRSWFQEVDKMSLDYLAILDNKKAIKDDHGHDTMAQRQTWRGSHWQKMNFNCNWSKHTEIRLIHALITVCLKSLFGHLCREPNSLTGKLLIKRTE